MDIKQANGPSLGRLYSLGQDQNVPSSGLQKPDFSVFINDLNDGINHVLTELTGIAEKRGLRLY